MIFQPPPMVPRPMAVATDPYPSGISWELTTPADNNATTIMPICFCPSLAPWKNVNRRGPRTETA